MKKIYLSALSMAVVSGLSAQVATTQLAPKNSTFESNKTSEYTASFEKVTVWTNDVSNAADWQFTNTSSPAQDWYIETDPAAVPSDGPVAMTSAANGYLMIDSDQAGQTATQDALASYVGGAIDLSAYPAVTLEFEQHYRTYLDERYVEVSNDGGTTWDSYTITDGTEGGGTVVSGIGSVDITATAGNQANVSIRFRYVGAWGWHWAVDDMLIKTTEPYDLRADGNAWGVVGTWGPRLPYYSTPIDQIQAIEFCGLNTNIGLNDIADATYTVDIASASYSGTGTINSVVGVQDTICAAPVFTPAGAVASFTATAAMSTTNPDTGVTNNDFTDITFGVTDYVYARDNSDAVVDGGSFNQGDGFESGNIYDIFAAADLTGIRVGINAAAVEGSSIYVKLYTIDAATGDFILEDQSLPYTLGAGDLGSYVTLPLVSGAYTLTADESYLVTVGSDGDGGLSNDLVVMTSGESEPQTTFYYDATDLTWYYSTSTSAVQMSFAPASLNENANVFGMGVYPNPANAEANVTFSLNNTADVNITVTDLSGKVVYTNALGNVAAGTTEVSVNTAALSNGVYMINVAADNAVSTEKLIVRK
ncbi:MAG: T9SS type A sorting domain-containing protein [Crocinitomicaceae bacterium]|nr:T9SS type A sorting domain-containing protein [Crocinitomicaceae bacterium]